ncbi:MAG: RebB family R body protein [Bacteroidota bacterium]
MDVPKSIQELQQLQELLGGIDNSKSLAMVNTVMAETLGMSMHNAVTAQQNAQMVNTAATTTTCARILSTFGQAPNLGIPGPMGPTGPPHR